MSILIAIIIIFIIAKIIISNPLSLIIFLSINLIAIPICVVLKKRRSKNVSQIKYDKSNEENKVNSVQKSMFYPKSNYTKIKNNQELFLLKKKEDFKNTVDSIPEFKIILSEEKHNRNMEINVADKTYKNVTKSTPITKIKDFVAFDTETTGLKTGGNDIIQLSAIKYKNFCPVKSFNTYIKPRKSIPSEATAVNGITDEMVKNAPKFYQIIDSFNEFIEDLPLVAHNAPFDVKHIYVNGLDSIENKTVYDTLALSRRIMKGEYSYKLEDICESANIYISNAHNSLYDCYAVGELFKYLVSERREISVDELIEIARE